MHLPWIEAFEDIFGIFITITIHGLELMGVVVVVSGAVSAFYNYFVRHSPGVRLSLAQSMAMGLEFKLGGEILRTVVAQDWNDILTVGAIILLRAALTLLIHWEISHIQHDDEVAERNAQLLEGLKEDEKDETFDQAVAHLLAEGHLSAEEVQELYARHRKAAEGE